MIPVANFPYNGIYSQKKLVALSIQQDYAAYDPSSESHSFKIISLNSLLPAWYKYHSRPSSHISLIGKMSIRSTSQSVIT